MRVRDGMLVRVIVLLDERIDDNDHGSRDHNAKTCKIGPAEPFRKNHKRQKRTNKKGVRFAYSLFVGAGKRT